MRRLLLPSTILFASAFAISCGSNSKTVLGAVPSGTQFPSGGEPLISRLPAASSHFGSGTESAQQLRKRCQAGRPTVENNWKEVQCILSPSNPGNLEFIYRGGRAKRTLDVSERVREGETIQQVVCDRDVISVVTNRGIHLFCGAEDLFSGQQDMVNSVSFDDANLLTGKLVGDTLYGVFNDGIFRRMVLTKDDGVHESIIPLFLPSKDLANAKLFANPSSDLFLILIPNGNSNSMGALLIRLDNEGNYRMKGGYVPFPMLYLSDAVPLSDGFSVKGELPPLERPVQVDITFSGG